MAHRETQNLKPQADSEHHDSQVLVLLVLVRVTVTVALRVRLHWHFKFKLTFKLLQCASV